MVLDGEDGFGGGQDGCALGLNNASHNFPKDSRLICQNSIKRGQDKLHQLPITIQIPNNIKNGIHVQITLINKQSMLTFPIPLRKLEKKLNGPRLEYFLMALEVVEA